MLFQAPFLGYFRKDLLPNGTDLSGAHEAALPLGRHLSAFDLGVIGFEIQEVRLEVFVGQSREENRQREGEGVEKHVRWRAQPARRVKRKHDGDGMVHVESV